VDHTCNPSYLAGLRSGGSQFKASQVNGLEVWLRRYSACFASAKPSPCPSTPPYPKKEKLSKGLLCSVWMILLPSPPAYGVFIFVLFFFNGLFYFLETESHILPRPASDSQVR
jgi:hypothetical protein